MHWLQVLRYKRLCENGCHKWSLVFLLVMHVRLGCHEWSLQYPGACALHIDAMLKSSMRQDVCRNMGVTSGLSDVLDVLSVDALMEDLMT